VPGVPHAHPATAHRTPPTPGEMPPLLATGGRVLNVVAVGKDFAQARRRAYEALAHVRLDGAQYRTDIAARVAE
jgi:phosphoribosylamine--glycine ligase